MSFTFLQKGAASAALSKQNAAEIEQKRSEQGKMFRFWLKPGEEAKITFIDGDLGPGGFLVPDRYYEHNLKLNATWNNFFVCPQKTNPALKETCPICESGEKPALVSLFTIIDHRAFPSRDKTKMYKDTRKLMVVKEQTFELLNKYAIKRGGLAGATFDVSRVGDKAAAVGSSFDFTEKRPIELLKKLYTREVIDPVTNKKTIVTNFEPANYDKEIVYRTAAELCAIGLGKPSMEGSGATTAGQAEIDYSEEL